MRFGFPPPAEPTNWIKCSDRERYDLIVSTKCGFCHAEPGEPCTTTERAKWSRVGKPVEYFHLARLRQAADTVNNPTKGLNNG